MPLFLHLNAYSLHMFLSLCVDKHKYYYEKNTVLCLTKLIKGIFKGSIKYGKFCIWYVL